MHRDRKEKGTAGEWEDGEFMLNKDTILVWENDKTSGDVWSG
jgi:hypothetical protein